MNINKIDPVYAINTKQSNDTLSHTEWNSISTAVNTAHNKINEVIDNVGEGGQGLPNMYINSKGNLNIETSTELGNTSKGKINIESMDDIQFKPGDDIILYSHHRAQDKRDEVAVKVTDGDDVPVKLQLNAAELTLTTKDKTGDNRGVFDINVNKGANDKGYLKVRAQAIDLRSESHGGIALQPKGYDGDGTASATIYTGSLSTNPLTISIEDLSINTACSYDFNITASNAQDVNIYLVLKNSSSEDTYEVDNFNFDEEDNYLNLHFGGQELYNLINQNSADQIIIGNGEIDLSDYTLNITRIGAGGNMNKIKFEHGGGDGLEFGTFNTEKTSIFTDEYRFKKDGVIKLATRTTQTSDKYDTHDETTHYKYVKQADDFYDIIDDEDPTCTWEDILKLVKWAKTNGEIGPWVESSSTPEAEVVNQSDAPGNGGSDSQVPAGGLS